MKQENKSEQEYMRRAIELAKKGAGWTSPNPLVGAVIVKDGRIIAEGWHHRYGDLHAERDALQNCTEDSAGATIYVTLEPCCHHGKQPPCVDALIEAGIARVVMGNQDPNPLVAGKGIRILEEHGIAVKQGFLEEECRQINEIFFHYITTGIPYAAMKYAMTTDGKIACYTGESKWITGEKAREHVHMLRGRYRGIMAGINTVLQDDPMLNCRIDGLRSPVRIICDSRLRIPLQSQIVKTAGDYETIIACSFYEEKKAKALKERGITVLPLKGADGRVDLSALMQELGQRKIDSILLEGGASLHWSMLEAGFVQKVYAYVAPKIFGGQAAKSPVEGTGFAKPADAVHLEQTRITRLGDDFLIEGTPVSHQG